MVTHRTLQLTLTSAPALLACALLVAGCAPVPEKLPEPRDTVKEAKAILKPKFQIQKARNAIAQGDAETALEQFNLGLQQAPENVDLLNGKAIALNMLSRHREAQSIYQTAIQLSPENNAFLHSNLALSYILDGDYDAAIGQLLTSGELENAAILRQNLAMAYGLKGDMENARKWGGKDLPAQQLEENINFYRLYREKLEANMLLPDATFLETSEPDIFKNGSYP